MGCCGEKRRQWAESSKSQAPAESSPAQEDLPVKSKNNREFEYTGDLSMVITGSATGAQYHFKFKGDRLSVDYFDSFSMMAERELRSI
jgi:hypothetical protein